MFVTQKFATYLLFFTSVIF